MKPKHVAAERINARAVLAGARIALGQDGDTLTRDQVDQILVEADRVHYQTPKDANGSRGRYFHALLQRRAR